MDAVGIEYCTIGQFLNLLSDKIVISFVVSCIFTLKLALDPLLLTLELFLVSALLLHLIHEEIT